MDFDIREEKTDFGTRWFIDDKDNILRFALYVYDDDPTTLYLSNVFVSENYRQRGLGNIILKMADEIAKSHGADTLMLKVLKKSFVHNWYERHGFEDFVCDDEDLNYMWMRKDI
jgi:GNAT superfamily N-acetyltransferase